MNVYLRLAAMVCLLTAASFAGAQQEFPPPQGKGRVVVLASGVSGPAHYTTIAREIAELGYDVVLFDGNLMEGTHGDGAKTVILQAQQMPHALPGRVALVGFCMGRGDVSLLRYAMARSGRRHRALVPHKQLHS
jgi:dienelactone hydrolase